MLGISTKMSNVPEEIATSLRTLNKDIVEGVESNAISKIPRWKKAMVSWTETL